MAAEITVCVAGIRSLFW